MIEDMKETLVAMAADSAKIREAAKSFLLPKEGTEEAKDALRVSNALGAVEVACSLVSIFSSLQTPTANAAFSMLTDLTIALNTNPFWVRNVGSLMPLLIAAVNGANDAREMDVNPEPRWNTLREQSRCLWLELLPQLIFLTHGYAAMRLQSVQMKKTFHGLLNG